MIHLLRYLKGLRGKAILAPFFKLFEAVLELFVPLCVASLIDRGIGESDKAYIIKMALLMIALGFAGLLSSITAQYFSASVATEATHRMRNDLFSHITSLSAIDRERIGSSTLLTRLTSDSNQFQSCINMFLRLFLRSPFVVLGAAIMASAVAPGLSWIYFVVIAILSAVVFLIMQKTIPMYKSVQSRLDNVVLLTRENLQGVRVIRAFSKEEEEIKAYNKALEDLKNEQLRSGKVSSLLNPLTGVIVNLAVALLIYVSSTKYKLNLIEIGTIVALVNYMNQILLELVKFANLIVTVTRGIASGNRIESVFEIKSSIVSPQDGKTGKRDSFYSVEFENVTLSYQDGGSPVLKDISFALKKGERLGIIGATGSGKSSIVNLIPRFYDVTSGALKVNGLEVKKWDLEELRNQISFVPQKARLFKGSVRENMKWGKEDATDDEIRKALRMAEAYSFIAEKEGELDFQIEQGGRNLSGGQRQRLSIARALLKDAPILIFDDSFSALDYKTESLLRKTISALEDKTVIVVSQRASSLLLMDNIMVLDKARIAEYGTHEELLRKSVLYREIYESQFGEHNE